MADAFDPRHAGRLEEPVRLEALPRGTVVALLRLDGAETVVEYGAGTGAYTLAVAEAVPHHLYDQPGALAKVVRLLRPGGLFVVVDWGDHERPVGPPLDHVLGLAAVRDIISGMGLEVMVDHEPGTDLPYRLVVVAAKP